MLSFLLGATDDENQFRQSRYRVNFFAFVCAMPLLQSDYKAPRWLPGAHLQTIVPARFFPRPDVQYRREIVDMPDGDFIVLDWSVGRVYH